jgi:hypothetical protein
MVHDGAEWCMVGQGLGFHFVASRVGLGGNMSNCYRVRVSWFYVASRNILLHSDFRLSLPPRARKLAPDFGNDTRFAPRMLSYIET